MYGAQWAKIKSQYFDILSSRTAVSIKDCYRNLAKHDHTFINNNTSSSSSEGSISYDEDTHESTYSDYKKEDGTQTKLKSKSDVRILALEQARRNLRRSTKQDPLEESIAIAEKVGVRQSDHSDNADCIASSSKSSKGGDERHTSSVGENLDGAFAASTHGDNENVAIYDSDGTLENREDTKRLENKDEKRPTYMFADSDENGSPSRSCKDNCLLGIPHRSQHMKCTKKAIRTIHFESGDESDNSETDDNSASFEVIKPPKPKPIPKSRRRRNPFTEEEKEAILKGYKKYGRQWAKIKMKYEGILESRTNVDIKDCHRNLTKHERYI